MAAPIVIVGGSLAGLRAAQAMRKEGESGEIVVIGAEPHLPYTRPPLSKGVLAGAESPESTDLGGGDLDVTWRLGIRASGLDRAAREVLLDDGERVPYRRLLIATGSRPRPWPGAGGDLDGVATLRSLADALELRSRLEHASRLITIGAGFIGCEVAATARQRGLDVAIVDIAPLPMTVFGEELGAWVAQEHRKRGVELHLGVGVEAIEGVGRVEAVRLADGARVEGDLALVALGAVPDVDWLEDSGIALSTGVLCDATLTSVSDPDVLAAGDACAWPHPMTDGQPLRVEHWTNAVEQGRLAGRNLLREPHERTPYTAVPSMWSDQYDIRIQLAGLPVVGERAQILEADPEGSRLAAAWSRDGGIRAAATIAAPRRMVWYRQQIERGAGIDEVAAAVRADESALGPPAEAVRA